ncbi:hypothetical protein [Cellulomonas sp. NPDC089187]|uniref:hypothetical protein n=1 Tax=Cellulomonas sp. NPDC089187 TaxID=3154970 RepID=UPI0034432D5F
MTVDESPNAFGITVPPSWEEIDLRPLTRDAAVRHMVDKRVQEAPELREHRTEMVRFLRNTVAQAWDSGAKFCAVFSEPAGEGVIPGTLTVTFLPPAPARPGEAMVDAITDQLQQSPAPAGEGVWQTLTMTELSQAGTAVQVYGVRDIDLNHEGYQVRAVVMNTFIPTDAGVLLVAGTSPALDVADALFELFAAVTDTLTLHALGPEEDDA